MLCKIVFIFPVVSLIFAYSSEILDSLLLLYAMAVIQIKQFKAGVGNIWKTS